MSRRKPSPEAAALPPTLGAERATQLLTTQVEAARPLLAATRVEQLAYDEWEQTTRAVLAGAFGDPSENVSRFERASPSYPGAVGEDDSFWAKYRRDEMEAKVATLQSSLAQLAMGLGSAGQGAPTTPGRHPYEDARAVLKVLHGYFLQYGNRNWSISAVKDGNDNFASVGLDADGAQRALQMLVSKGLAEYMGTNAFVITEYGISVSDHAEQLDRELPVERVTSSRPGAEATAVDLARLASVGDLLANDDLRDIVLRDIGELARARQHGLAKSVMLLGGTILEGILIDVLDRNRAVAATYMKKRRFPEEASLIDLIAIAGDAALLDAPRHLLTPTSVALAKAVTDHRDLIHPHAEARGRIVVDETTASALCHLIVIVVRDLHAAKERGDIAAYETK